MEGGRCEIYRLPAECICHILSLTSPRDSCRSAAVSPALRSAADSDAVWERFLPSDYREILSRAVHPVVASSKKELYFRLCDSLPIDGGRKIFALEKESGGKCYTVCARDLFIAGSNEQWWRWIPRNEFRIANGNERQEQGRRVGLFGFSFIPGRRREREAINPQEVVTRFSEVAELEDICWLEIRGKIDSKALSPSTAYVIYLIFTVENESRGLNFPAQEATVTIGNHVSRHSVCLQPQEDEMQRRSTIHELQRWRMAVGAEPLEEEEETTIRNSRAPRMRKDGWLEMEMGDFFSGNGDDGEVEMCFKEVKGGHWKRGLIIEGMEVRPRN